MKLNYLYNEKYIEKMKIIEEWTKRTSVGWLRKQRDGIIGYLEEQINQIKCNEQFCYISKKDLMDTIKELSELNKKIYDIEFSIYI